MSSRRLISIIVVDDHPVTRHGIINMLSVSDRIRVVGEADNAISALRKISELDPDIVLLDIRLPGASGIDVCQTLRRRSLKSRAIILTSYENEDYLFDALRAGAWGYLLKTAGFNELERAIISVSRGIRMLSETHTEALVDRYSQTARKKAIWDSGLNQEELEILRMICEGSTNDEIAQELHWSEVTIKRRLHSIFEKLDVENRTSAAVEAIDQGLI